MKIPATCLKDNFDVKLWSLGFICLFIYLFLLNACKLENNNNKMFSECLSSWRIQWEFCVVPCCAMVAQPDISHTFLHIFHCSTLLHCLILVPFAGFCFMAMIRFMCWRIPCWFLCPAWSQPDLVGPPLSKGLAWSFLRSLPTWIIPGFSKIMHSFLPQRYYSGAYSCMISCKTQQH